MEFNSHPPYDIIVHSHLRWDWVWQRPQQFLSRLATRHRVLFVEGPEVHAENVEPYFTLQQAQTPNVMVLRTHFPAARFGQGAWVDTQRRRLIETALQGPMKGRFTLPVQWFYDPMAVEAHAGRHGEIATVYDCMDELSQFKFAPPELIARERRLLAHADVVFTGGRKMWHSKSRFNRNCHFYGCGVDTAHFGAARHDRTQLPADMATLGGPILGYFGVIDERLDYDLIAALAEANQAWHVVMVGPTCKINLEDLPRSENLHWLGPRQYAELPAYARAFNVCLMPFALNQATEFINPTKALEYLATATPVVSTAVPDVVSNFHSVVHIGDPLQFIEHCRRQVHTPDKAAVERGLKMAAENTWDAVVAKLEKHVDQAVVRVGSRLTLAEKINTLQLTPLSIPSA